MRYRIGATKTRNISMSSGGSGRSSSSEPVGECHALDDAGNALCGSSDRIVAVFRYDFLRKMGIRRCWPCERQARRRRKAA